MSRNLERILPVNAGESFTEPLDNFLDFVETHTADNFLIVAPGCRRTTYVIEDDSQPINPTRVLIEQAMTANRISQMASVFLLADQPARKASSQPELILKITYESVFSEAYLSLQHHKDVAPLVNPKVIARNLERLAWFEARDALKVVERTNPHLF
jgi:hypothetical protein